MAGEQGTPHRVVDQILGGLVGGAQGVVQGIGGGLTGAGEMVQRGLDQPWKQLNGPEQPLRALDRLLDGTVAAATNSLNQGLLGTLKAEGEAIQSALDHPSQQVGIPPGLGGNMGLGRSPLSGMGRNFPRLPFGR